MRSQRCAPGAAQSPRPDRHPLSSPAPLRAHITPAKHRLCWGIFVPSFLPSPQYPGLAFSRLEAALPSGTARTGGARGERGRGAQRAGSQG